MRLGLALGVLAVLADQQPARDRFVEQRDAAAALNPRSPRFTIAVEGDRRSFRVGERIPLVFTYDNLNRSILDANDFSYRHFADAMLDRPAGTGRPGGDFERSGLYISGGMCCGEPGGVVGGATTRFGGFGFDTNGVPYFLPDVKISPPPPPPPVSMTLPLNEGVRFDAPGRYRLYMADRHEAEFARRYGRPVSPPLISNIVEFEITRDETWETQTLRDAMAVLDGFADLPERKKAARTLGFLGSRDAIDLMTGLLLNRKFGDVSFELEQGLFGARDRAYVIGVLEGQVDDVSQPISWSHLRRLAALRLTRSRAGPLTSNDRYRAVLAVHHRRLRGLAAAGVLSDRLKLAFEASVAERAPEAPLSLTHAPEGPALTRYVKQVEAVLMRMPPPIRESVLSAHSMIVGDADGFAPMLKRLAAAGSPVAKRLLTDFTAPSNLPEQLDSVDTSDGHVSASYDPETRRRIYRAGGRRVAFVELGLVFSRFPRGAVLTWFDHLDWHWELDREAEFRRVEQEARRFGLKFNRRPARP